VLIIHLRGFGPYREESLEPALISAPGGVLGNVIMLRLKFDAWLFISYMNPKQEQARDV
jgi:hypothetical protein